MATKLSTNRTYLRLITGRVEQEVDGKSKVHLYGKFIGKSLLSLRGRGFKNLYEPGAVVQLRNSSIVKFLLDLSTKDMVINTSCFVNFIQKF